MSTQTEIRVACRVEPDGRRFYPTLSLIHCGPDDLINPGGYILRVGFRAGRRLRTFAAAVKAYEARRELLGFTTIRNATGPIPQEATV
jgi:hypothetical protein